MASLSLQQREIVSLAADLEDRPALWAGRYRRLMASGLLAGLGSRALEFQSDPASLGQFGFRFDVIPGDEALYTRSIQQLAARLAGAVAAGRPAAVDLSAAPGTGPSHLSESDRFSHFLSALELRLPPCLGRLGLSVRDLHLSLLASHPGQKAFLALRFSARLGKPHLLLRLPEEMMPGQDGPAEDWARLTALGHGHPRVDLLPAQMTRPISDWCPAELADSVLPVLRVSAPADTAWLAVALDVGVLARVGRARGPAGLRRVLGWCLRFADNLVDLCPWPGAGLTADAQNSRRICLQLTGMGQLVRSRRLDPRLHSNRARLERWLRSIRNALLLESRYLAQQRGPFPALGVEELSRSVQRRLGGDLARLATSRVAFRHRHILAISPFDLIPGDPGDFQPGDYLNLAPLTAVADVFSLYRVQGRHGLSLEEYRRLLQLSWAAARPPANRSCVIAAPAASML